jgi:hypothetical protein
VFGGAKVRDRRGGNGLVTAATVECWGGGGDGGTSGNQGGGSGGDYARKNSFATTPGNGYTVHVSAGSGDDTYFDTGSQVYAVAGVGPGVAGGGTTLGDVTFTGGGSGASSGKGNRGGGGGGAGASDNANGGAGGANSGNTGGTGASTTTGTTYNGGAGGDGGTYNTVQATNGTAPGGGGGGAYTGGTAGVGAVGKVVITYSSPLAQEGSGKLTFNGIATQKTSGTFNPLGSLLLSGIAVLQDGGFLLSGLAVCAASYKYLASGSLLFTSPKSTILYANGNGTNGSWTDQSGGTTNLYLTVDEGTGSVNDADYVKSGTASDTITFQLTDTPSDFVSAIGIIISVRHQSDTSKSTPMYVEEIQIVTSDNTTAITGTVSSTADTTLTTYRYSPSITGTNTKTNWDGARIRFKTRELLPLPESPVMAIILPRGISTDTFFRLCVLAPRTIMESCSVRRSDAEATSFLFSDDFGITQ